MSGPLAETNDTGEAYAQRITQLVQDLHLWARDLDVDTVYRRVDASEWTVMENLVHAAEALTYWSDQVWLVIKSPGQPFGRTHEDPDRIAHVATHAADELHAVLVRLLEAGDYACTRLRAIPDDAWAATGVHRRGEMVLPEVVEFFITEHLADHSTQAKDTARLIAADGAP